MLYRQKKDTYIRNYDGVGYITSTGIFNDRIVNQSGTIFLCALSRTPQTLDELTDKILPQFTGVDRETIKSDAQEFYETLIQDGFIIKGETEEELNAKDIGFTYNSILPKQHVKILHRQFSAQTATLRSFWKSILKTNHT